MPFVDEAPAYAAGPSVQVLVGTPDSEVHVPVVQMQFQVSHGVGEVESHDTALPMARCRNPVHFEGLAGQVVHPAQEDQGDGLALPFEQVLDVPGADRVFPFPRMQFDHAFHGVVTVPRRL